MAGELIFQNLSQSRAGAGKECRLKKKLILLHCLVHGFHTLLEDYVAMEDKPHSPRGQFTAGNFSHKFYVKSNAKHNWAAICLSTQLQKKSEDTPPICFRRY